MNTKVSFSQANMAAPGMSAIIRRVMERAAGQTVLRVALPGQDAGARLRRRLASTLLHEAALGSGGQLVQGRNQDLALLGLSGPPADHVRRRLTEFGYGGATLSRWDMPRDSGEFLAWVQDVTPGDPVPPRDPLRDFDALVARLGVDGLLQSAPLLRVLPGQAAARPVGRYLWLCPDALARMLGPAGEDADLLDHAAQRVLRRLRRGFAGFGGAATPLCLPMPADDGASGGVPPVPCAGSIAVLPVSLAADQVALAAMAGALRAAGWQTAMLLDAALLTVLDPGLLLVGTQALDRLLLHWSDALATEAAAAALAPLDPERLLLVQCQGAAVAWGMARGIATFAPAAGATIGGAA